VQQQATAQLSCKVARTPTWCLGWAFLFPAQLLRVRMDCGATAPAKWQQHLETIGRE
jgi:hypothetical protein